MKKLSMLFVVGFAFVVFLFFSKSFLGGFALQGTDLNHGLLTYMASNMKDISSIWYPFLWLGTSLGEFFTSAFNTTLLWAPNDLILTITYSISMILAFLFTFLLLKKYRLSSLSSAFAAVAYAFSPVFLALINGGHTAVIDFMAYPPMLVYFISNLLMDEDKDFYKTSFSILLSGFAWGTMMADEPQRGLYISIMVFFYILYLLVKRHQINLKTIVSKALANAKFWLDIGKVFLVGLVLLLTFWTGIESWLKSGFLQTDKGNKTVEVQKSEEEKWSFSSSFSQHPLDLIDNLAYGFHGIVSGDSEYPYWGERQGNGEFKGNTSSVGYFVFLFAILAIIVFFKKDGLVRFFAIAGIVTILLSFGKYAPGTPFFWLFYKLPMMEQFRVPEKFMTVASFCLAILAGFGLSAIQSAFAENRKKFLADLMKFLGILAGVGVIGVFIIMISSSNIASEMGQKFNNYMIGNTIVNNMLFALLRMSLFSLILIALLAMLLKWKENKNIIIVFSAVLIALSTADLWNINAFFLEKSIIKSGEFYRPDGVVSFIKNELQREIFRVGTSLKIPQRDVAYDYPITGLRGYYVTYSMPFFRIEPFDNPAFSRVDPEYNSLFMTMMLSNMNTLEIKTYGELVNINLKLYRLANVKYLIADAMIEHPDLLLTNIVKGYDGKDKYIMLIKDYLPRVAFYENYLTMTNERDILNTLADRSIDIGNLVIVHSPSEDVIRSTNRFIPQQIVSYKPWKITVSADVPTDGFLMLSVKRTPDWKATVDGTPTPLYSADYIMQGVFLKAGKHMVEFSYGSDSKGYWAGIIILLAGILLWVVYFVRNLLGSAKGSAKEA